VLEARCAVCTAAVGFGCGYSCSLLLGLLGSAALKVRGAPLVGRYAVDPFGFEVRLPITIYFAMNIPAVMSMVIQKGRITEQSAMCMAAAR